jgi:GDPmannose 4,6-dehydratase
MAAMRELGPAGNVPQSVEEWEEVNPQFLRTGEIHNLRADARRARAELGWQPTVDFKQLVRMMFESDLAAARGE